MRPAPRSPGLVRGEASNTPGFTASPASDSAGSDGASQPAKHRHPNPSCGTGCGQLERAQPVFAHPSVCNYVEYSRPHSFLHACRLIAAGPRVSVEPSEHPSAMFTTRRGRRLQTTTALSPNSLSTDGREHSHAWPCTFRPETMRANKTAGSAHAAGKARAVVPTPRSAIWHHGRQRRRCSSNSAALRYRRRQTDLRRN